MLWPKFDHLRVSYYYYDLYAEYPNAPEVLWRATNFTLNNATVIVELVQEVGVSYNLSVVPYPLESKIISENTSQLTVLYNTSYRVTVLAELCEQNIYRNMTAIDINVSYIGKTDVCNIDYLKSLSLFLIW